MESGDQSPSKSPGQGNCGLALDWHWGGWADFGDWDMRKGRGQQRVWFYPGVTLIEGSLFINLKAGQLQRGGKGLGLWAGNRTKRGPWSNNFISVICESPLFPFWNSLNFRIHADDVFVEFLTLPHPKSQDILLDLWFYRGLPKQLWSPCRGKTKRDPSWMSLQTRCLVFHKERHHCINWHFMPFFFFPPFLSVFSSLCLFLFLCLSVSLFSLQYLFFSSFG